MTSLVSCSLSTTVHDNVYSFEALRGMMFKDARTEIGLEI